MNLSSLLLPPIPPIWVYKGSIRSTSPRPFQIPIACIQNSDGKSFLLSNLISLAVAVTLNSPLPSLAIPSLNSQTPLLPSTTPFSQSKNLEIGLEDGKIRPCPSINPGCISTNPKSSSFAFPWVIPANASENAVEKLQEAILKTQKNAKIQTIENTPDGQYLRAEVDGDFGRPRDVLEFLVKGDVVAYRCMATKVTYVYPFTTAIGDSKGQQERLKNIMDQLGWYAPSFDSMD
ncbi:PREDICTED: thylakoid lumenal 17.9 kDa protein, chloroplastic [Nelumbo nucifera]|uniref:Thylakoid lumenal 17.9 kDa protein, chloroplastic n=1 Tax=Nelumbo nucifera TaxID=4432 RepID=A0A1U7Z948_NELNU|nr:PREDICTED: thylakoid lumenal 17.9 kDa protein, chloroplastic [Nelumbo nucifera]